MVNDVHVWGDSHWRVFFPFVNHESPGVSHEQDGVRTIDMCANELSGSTMYGLLNDNSKHGARRRILSDIDKLGGIDNIGLVVGEVDARFHHQRYFVDGKISDGRIYETLARYRRFIDEDLLFTKRVRKNVFVYHGFSYPQREATLLQPGQPIGHEGYEMADYVNNVMGALMEKIVCGFRVHVLSRTVPDSYVSPDGVHLIPELIYPSVLNMMRSVFDHESMVRGKIPF